MVRRLPRGLDLPLPAEGVLIDPRPLVVAAGIGAAAWLQGPAGESATLRGRNDFRYTPDPRIVRVVAGAHRSSAADLLWLRTLPDLSQEFADVARKARWIDNSLDAITDLEPTFGTVYDFGQSYLFNPARPTPESVARAEKLLRKGIDRNPRSAGLWVRLAMVYYFADGADRRRTIAALQAASLLPGFDSLSAAMLSSLLAKQRDDVPALAYWAGLLEKGTPAMRRRAELLLWRTKLTIAARAARQFEQENGRKPATPAEIATPSLVDAQVVAVILEGLEITPEGAPGYPHLDDLEHMDEIRGAEEWARRFRDDAGRWPTMDEFAEQRFRLRKPPAGKRWSFEGGELTLVGE